MRQLGWALAIIVTAACSSTNWGECLYVGGSFTEDETQPDPSLEFGFTYTFQTMFDRWSGDWSGRYPGANGVQPFEFSLHVSHGAEDLPPLSYFEFDDCDPDPEVGKCDWSARKMAVVSVHFDAAGDQMDYDGLGYLNVRGYHLGCVAPEALRDSTSCGCLLLGMELVDGGTRDQEFEMWFHLSDDGRLYMSVQRFGPGDWVEAELQDPGQPDGSAES